jgi:nucleoside-diphosphate-sugar epimerase
MVIGNGLIGKRFESYQRRDDFLIFASGVSNSKTTDPDAYNREMKLLKESVEQDKNKSVIYFSTCSIYDPEEKNSIYVQHKLNIEKYIQTNARLYYIFRISNLAGKSGNPNTVLNFFFFHIKNGINFDLWTNACRNIIDIDHAYLIIDHILKKNLFTNHMINIANPVSYPVKDIITAIESYLNIRSNYIKINKGNYFDIDISSIKPIIQDLEIIFNEKYLIDLLNKYFSRT